jgi:hypothetical protein
MVFSCAVVLLTGCNAPEKDEPIWQQVKIGDLAPSDNGKRPAGRLLKTTNFNIYTFEIPAENIDTLDDVWQMLYTKPLRFNDYDAFKANSFLVGFGQVQMWDKIANLLHTADGKKVQTASLLLPDGQANDLTIARLDNELTIFYISSAGSMEGAAVGPGKLALRIKAEKIPGSRGVRDVDIKPAFSPLIKSLISQPGARKKPGELLFTSAGFKLKMSPRDFIFLGPEKYISPQATLDSLFFTRHKPKPVVRTYLIVCTRIID